ncbi:hypothetical protein BKA63DRAFT_504686 [Paraphoma chrysanthemicola]|nr:hypothetical protein BKA63DRAFT_504686 [Paraphoma chrysanthemicola]
MNRLPRELIDNICAFLPKDDLKNLLTVSVPFRYAAEMHSGAFEKFTIDESNSEKFLALCSGHRLPYLRDVIFRPGIAELIRREHADGCLECRENEQELLAKDEVFTNQIKILFNTLKLLEEQGSRRSIIGRYILSIYSLTTPADREEHCLHLCHVGWRVHLLNPSELPQLSCVWSLEIHNTDHCDYSEQGEERKLDSRIIIDLATKLPNLHFLGFQTGAFEWFPISGEDEEQERMAEHYYQDWSGPRRDARDDFASAVAAQHSQLPSSLRCISLDFLSPLDRSVDSSHWRDQPNLIGLASKDPFSFSLRIIANNLRRLRLRGVLDESLFWPDANTETFGPNLEYLEITFHVARPDGKWYFHGPRGEGRNTMGYEVTDGCYPPFNTSDLDRDFDSDSDGFFPHYNVGSRLFRIVPHDSELTPLLAGFAKAAAQMRRLKRGMLWSPLRWTCDDESDFEDYFLEDELNSTAFGIVYTAPDSKRDYDWCRSLIWDVGDWRPGSELHELFQHIGRAEHGEDLKEYWYRGPNYTEFYTDFFCVQEWPANRFPQTESYHH